jgi:hypothetical protein
MHRVDMELKIIHQNLAMTKLKLMDKKGLTSSQVPFSSSMEEKIDFLICMKT